eukprot:TRINITY_DN574_c0_g1_i4.p2 TRINITY_DN574_c0_g1~~TRINITY_DN574_c0_g1_i4.p2  ORF type:complete len:117 (-),score=48.82 TRINITY_DN574_c0_g1_i4:96-446(-)
MAFGLRPRWTSFSRPSTRAKSSLTVGGRVCFKSNCMAVARHSPTSLYSADLSSMENVDGYQPSDAGGFIRINAVRLKAHRKILLATDRERLANAGPIGTTYAAVLEADKVDSKEKK